MIALRKTHSILNIIFRSIQVFVSNGVFQNGIIRLLIISFATSTAPTLFERFNTFINSNKLGNWQCRISNGYWLLLISARHTYHRCHFFNFVVFIFKSLTRSSGDCKLQDSLTSAHRATIPVHVFCYCIKVNLDVVQSTVAPRSLYLLLAYNCNFSRQPKRWAYGHNLGYAMSYVQYLPKSPRCNLQIFS